MKLDNAGFSGKYKVKILRHGKVRFETEFKNLLTNTFFGSAKIFAYCSVGSGTTPPEFTDAYLESQIGTFSAQSIATAKPGTFSGTVLTKSIESVFEFAIGQIVGNISEVAVRQDQTGPVSSRALIKDAGGTPTTITLTAEDQLIVAHTLFASVETRPNPVVMDIAGVSTTVTTKIFKADIYTGDMSGNRIDSNPKRFPYASNTAAGSYFGSSSAVISGQPIDGAEGYASISGTYLTTSVAVATNYGVGSSSYEATYTMSAGTNFAGNLPLKYIAMTDNTTSSTGKVVALVEFDPPITKTTAQAIVAKYKRTWSRV